MLLRLPRARAARWSTGGTLAPSPYTPAGTTWGRALQHLPRWTSGSGRTASSDRTRAGLPRARGRSTPTRQRRGCLQLPCPDQASHHLRRASRARGFRVERAHLSKSFNGYAQEGLRASSLVYKRQAFGMDEEKTDSLTGRQIKFSGKAVKPDQPLKAPEPGVDVSGLQRCVARPSCYLASVGEGAGTKRGDAAPW